MRKNTLSASLLVFLSAALLYGCTGPIKVSYSPVSPVSEEDSVGRARHRPVPILIKPFTDKRPGLTEVEDPKTIGGINATVSDIYGNRAILSRPPAAIVTEGFKKEFSASGYTVLSAGEEKDGAGIILAGEIRRFSLNIGPRDEIDIEVYTELRDRDTDTVIWSGGASEKGSRYAGVMGDSRSTISKYISAALSKVIRKTIKEAAPEIDKATAPEEDKKEANEVRRPMDTGRLLLTTAPPRVKVYLNGVYYGLTPLTVEINTGVYDLVLKKAGFMDFKEKVAVGKGRTTEMETAMKRQ